MKIFRCLPIPLLCFTTMTFQVLAQKDTSNTTTRKQRLLILPAAKTPTHTGDIEEEVTAIVASAAAGLRRFEVIDRSNLDALLREQNFQMSDLVDPKEIMRVGKIASADQALLVSGLTFSQQEAPEKDQNDNDNDLTFSEQLILIAVEAGASLLTHKEEGEKNIETQLSVHFQKISVETGQILYAFDVDATHTGGGRGKSRAKTLAILKQLVVRKLKEMYLINSEVLDVQGQELYMILGSDLGVRRGDLYELISPPKLKTLGGRSFKIPGRTKGFCRVADVADDGHRSNMVRQWGPVKRGYQAVEMTKRSLAFQIDAAPPVNRSYENYGIRLHIHPLGPWDFGPWIHLTWIKDTRNETDGGFGLGVFGSRHILSWNRLNAWARTGIGFDAFRKYDDQGNNVQAGLLNLPAVIEFRYALSPGMDLSFTTGYRFGSKGSHWTYTTGNDKNQITNDAVWSGAAPKINNSGPLFSAGLLMLLFW